MSERIELFNKYHVEINSRMMSNTENYDKSILSLSTTLLGLSIVFIKDIIPFDTAIYSWLLSFSWLCFIIAIISSYW